MQSHESISASSSPRHIHTDSIEEICIRTIVALGGGVYLGTSNWLAWFKSPQTGSTLALPISRLSADAVRRHIAQSNARFAEVSQ